MIKTNREAVILDDLIPLHISYLNQHFDLKRVGKSVKEVNLYGFNHLSREKEIKCTLRLTVRIDLGIGHDFVQVDYWMDGKHKTQMIELIPKKGPIGRGFVWYLRCPITNKPRRKLFLYNGSFISKAAIPNPHYKSQIESRKQRQGMRTIKGHLKDRNIVQQGEERHFRKFYSGNITKRYMKVLEAQQRLKYSW